MIDYAEALTVIDVNSGSFIGRGKAARLEDTITKTNLEAAEEVVNQLRLRDIGGIIVIDFIDMARARNRDAVLKTLRKALDEDRTKTFVVEISPLGLVEMTRQNVTDGVREIMTKPCPTCDGEGVVKSEETIAIEVERQLRELVARTPAPRRPRPSWCGINPRVTRLVHRRRRARCCTRSRRRPGSSSTSRAPRGCRSTTSRSSMEGTRDEVAEQAVPFREGDEVHVDIVEPHMYNVDDAVAKIDGYIISVANGGRLRRREELVRIEEAGRTAATRGARPSPTPRRERGRARSARRVERASASAAAKARAERERGRRRRGRQGRAGRGREALAGDGEASGTARPPRPESRASAAASRRADEARRGGRATTPRRPPPATDEAEDGDA